jgi:hypothetical protein
METDAKLNGQPSPAAPADIPMADTPAPVERQASEQQSEEVYKLIKFKEIYILINLFSYLRRQVMKK